MMRQTPPQQEATRSAGASDDCEEGAGAYMGHPDRQRPKTDESPLVVDVGG